MADGITFYNNPFRVTGNGTGKRKPFIYQIASGASNQGAPHDTATLLTVLNTTVDRSGITYSTSNYRFTVPCNGEYMVHVKINYASDFSSDNDTQLSIRRNQSASWAGNTGIWYVPDSQGNTWYKSFHNEAIVPMSRNDYIDFTFTQYTGSSRTISGSMSYAYIHLL